MQQRRQFPHRPHQRGTGSGERLAKRLPQSRIVAPRSGSGPPGGGLDIVREALSPCRHGLGGFHRGAQSTQVHHQCPPVVGHGGNDGNRQLWSRCGHRGVAVAAGGPWHLGGLVGTNGSGWHACSLSWSTVVPVRGRRLCLFVVDGCACSWSTVVPDSQRGGTDGSPTASPSELRARAPDGLRTPTGRKMTGYSMTTASRKETVAPSAAAEHGAGPRLAVRARSAPSGGPPCRSGGRPVGASGVVPTGARGLIPWRLSLRPVSTA